MDSGGMASCMDQKCPVHGSLRTRGRIFHGYVSRKQKTRIAIEFERVIKIRKYDRYAKAKTRVHAHVPACLRDAVAVGDYVAVQECRPLSRIIHHVLVKVIEDRKRAEEEKKQ